MRQFWNAKELRILKLGWPRWQRQRLQARLPGRTWVSILVKAGKLGCTRRRGGWWLRTRYTIKIPKSRTTIAYAAGLVDGEGHISQSFSGKYTGWIVGVSNTNVEVIHWLQNTFGGGVYTGHPAAPRKIKYMWHCSGRLNCLRLLEALRPFLIIKRKRADLFIDHLRPYRKALQLGLLPPHLRIKLPPTR